MFFEPQQSEFDLKWRMFGVHIRVHPWFWLMAAILGWSSIRLGFAYLFLWIACVFVSLLVHEFGHVFMSRAFGAERHIVLHALGGYAIGDRVLHNRWQRIAVSLAGPAAGFALAAVAWLCLRRVDEDRLAPMTLMGLAFLLGINLFWNCLNLLPIHPLDGGQVARDFLKWLIPESGYRVSLIISLVLAGLLAANCLYVHFRDQSLPFLVWIPYLEMLGSPINALLFGSLAFDNYQELSMDRQWRRPWREEW